MYNTTINVSHTIYKSQNNAQAVTDYIYQIPLYHPAQWASAYHNLLFTDLHVETLLTERQTMEQFS